MDRRVFTKSLLLTSALSAAGCSSAMSEAEKPTVYRSGFLSAIREWRIERNPTFEFVHEYKARTDNGFRLPEIPVEKINDRYLRQRVSYASNYAPGTVVVDVANRFLYLIEPAGKAVRYGVGVGRQGFAWQGAARIGLKREWPIWTPPAPMIRRQPELAKYSAANGGMEPGLNNPLGARALYLYRNGRDTLYRLHGTPQWKSIGTAVSSGCIRLMNQDIIDLYRRVPVGAKVVVKQNEAAV